MNWNIEWIVINIIRKQQHNIKTKVCVSECFLFILRNNKIFFDKHIDSIKVISFCFYLWYTYVVVVIDKFKTYNKKSKTKESKSKNIETKIIKSRARYLK